MKYLVLVAFWAPCWVNCAIKPSAIEEETRENDPELGEYRSLAPNLASIHVVAAGKLSVKCMQIGPLVLFLLYVSLLHHKEYKQESLFQYTTN